MFKNYFNKMVGADGYNLKDIPLEYQDEVQSLSKKNNKVRRFKLINNLSVLHRYHYQMGHHSEEADSVFNYMKYVTKRLGSQK
jgi:hypothetical protein